MLVQTIGGPSPRAAKRLLDPETRCNVEEVGAAAAAAELAEAAGPVADGAEIDIVYYIE